MRLSARYVLPTAHVRIDADKGVVVALALMVGVE